MRLLVTTDALGGVWQYSTDLAAALIAHGVEIVLAVMGPAAAPAAPAGVQLVETGLPLDWTAPDPAELARSTAALAGLAREVRATGIHLHAPALVGDAAWPAPVVAVAHSCVATWWESVRGGDLPFDLAWRARATAAGLRAADAVIAPTHAFADALRRVYGPLDLTVVHNGRSTEPLPRRPERRVLTAGRLWDEGKNVAALDRVAARLDAPVVAAGPVDGPGVSVRFDHLNVLGTLGPGALTAERSRAAVFASVPRYEPFGLAVLEAAQQGLPLVLSDIPTLRELWDGAALFVHDDATLLDALRQTLDDPGDHGRRAERRARRYTVEDTAERTLAVWKGVKSLGNPHAVVTAGTWCGGTNRATRTRAREVRMYLTVVTDILSRMKVNPQGDWKIADVQTVCRQNGAECTAPTGGGSHWKVSHPKVVDVLTMPARRPIKPVYIRKLVKFIEEARA